MPSTDSKHNRRSIRLRDYDYSQPRAYFITICAHDRACLFGDIVGGEMRLNDAGRMVQQCWDEIPQHFPHVELDQFVVMPNHVHGIVVITHHPGTHTVGAKNFSPLHHQNGTSRTIGSIIRGFKIGVTKWARANKDINTVWQRNYYEHIIRNEDDLRDIRAYIQYNPQRWAEDDLHV